MSENKIDELFKNTLDGHQDKPSDKVWGGIVAAIPARPFAGLLSKAAAGIGVMTVVGGFMWLGYQAADTKYEDQLAEQQATIEALQQQLADREGTISTLTGNVADLESNVAELTAYKNNHPDVDPVYYSNAAAPSIAMVNSGQRTINQVPNPNYQTINTNTNVYNVGNFDNTNPVDDLNATLASKEGRASQQFLPLRNYLGQLIQQPTIIYIQPRDPIAVGPPVEVAEAREKAFNIKGIHVGPVVRYSSIWLLNQNTFDEFEFEAELNYKPTFGMAYGIAAGYDFSANFGLQAELIVNSRRGQDYEDHIYRQKKKVTRNVALSYSALPIVLKYKLSKMTRMNPNVTNLVFGVQYAYLRKADIEITQDRVAQNDIPRIFPSTVNSIDYFYRHDFGLVFGWEQDYHFTDNLFFTLGTRGVLGLNDINRTEKALEIARQSDTYRHNRSHNFTIGATAGLNYIIK